MMPPAWIANRINWLSIALYADGPGIEPTEAQMTRFRYLMYDYGTYWGRGATEGIYEEWFVSNGMEEMK